MLKLSDHLYIPPMGRIIEEKQQAKAATTARVQKRYYAAAKSNRLNADWAVTPVTANLAMQQSLRTLRSRAREVATDSAHFKKFLSMCRANIIGHKGIQLQCRARTSEKNLNGRLNKRVEELFWQWSFAETCTVSGKLDWIAAQRLFVTTLARDGEVLVQHVKADNEFGYSIKFINVDYLDETYNEERSNGNRIIMSVEVDQDDKPVAYWLTPPATDVHPRKRDRRFSRADRTRVPAEEMIHAFLIHDDETQVRGVTWFHAALLDAKNLYGYKEGVITSARMAACSLGFLEQTSPDETEYVGEEDEDGRVAPLSIDVAPLSMNELPPGYQFKQFDPKQPTQNHSEFYKSMTLDVATALDVHYFSLAGDMEAVNFSSARVGLNEERDVWRAVQDFVATAFCRQVFHRWVDEAVLAGSLTLTPREYAEIRNPMWRPRSWEYIDPQKETNAIVTALENKLTTWTAVLNERGIDIYDHLETLESEQELAAKYGVELKTAKMAEPAEPEPEAEDDVPPKREFTNGHGVEILN